MKQKQALLTLSCALIVFAIVNVLFVAPGDAFTNFITRSGDKLMDGAQEFRFISFNDDSILRTWGGNAADPFEQEDALRTISQMGGRVLRVYTLTVGTSNAHVTAPNTFSEEYFRALDKLLQLANQFGVRLRYRNLRSI